MVPPAILLLAKLAAESKANANVVKPALAEFMRTHQDEWERHREAFDETTLDALHAAFEAPSYFC